MKENFTYTAPYSEAHISADISAMAMLFIDAMCYQQEQDKSYGELIVAKDALAQCGFINSQNAKLLGEMTSRIETYEAAANALSFIEEVWDNLNKDALLVHYPHFFQILEKYDMVCGSFDRYINNVPQSIVSKVQELGLSKELLKKYTLAFSFQECLTYNEEEDVKSALKIVRMPFLTNSDSTPKWFSCYRPECHRNHVFIAAPAVDMKPIKMSVYGSNEFQAVCDEGVKMGLDKKTEHAMMYIWGLEMKRRLEHKKIVDIYAKSEVAKYADIEGNLQNSELHRISSIALICSLTPCGVLIHAKWGPEAEDATIKRYEQLRDAVIGKGSVE